MKNYDVIIAGCGVAGLYGAINLPHELKVLVLSKREPTLCNSSLAQGGIAGVYKNPADSPEKHKNDTFVAGGFENDPVTTDILVNEAAANIDKPKTSIVNDVTRIRATKKDGKYIHSTNVNNVSIYI